MVCPIDTIMSRSELHQIVDYIAKVIHSNKQGVTFRSQKPPFGGNLAHLDLNTAHNGAVCTIECFCQSFHKVTMDPSPNSD